MRNGEFKLYKGKKITKVHYNEWKVGGTWLRFKTYDEAKSFIDAELTAWNEDMDE